VNVSLFANAFGGMPQTIQLSDIIQATQSGVHKPQIDSLRALLASGDKNGYDREKRNLPAFTVSGECADRTTLLRYSGFIQADMDNLNGDLEQTRQKAKNDPHVGFGYVSPSGNGLKLAVRVPADASRHKENFAAVANYLRKSYGREIDPQCKDPLRLCFMSSDTEAWINEGAVELDVANWRQQPQQLVNPRGQEEFLVLPSGPLSISESARGIFSSIAPTNTLFYRGGGVVEAAVSDDGCLSLRAVTPPAFCSRIEGYGKRIGAWRSDDAGGYALKVARCSNENATLLLASLEAEECLPKIRTISAAPVLTEQDGEIVILGRGYYPANGGVLIASGEMPPNVDVDTARSALLALLQDFDLPTPGDQARAVASILSPCLKFGRLLGEADFPLDVAEAPVSQSGKTYRQKVVTAVYREEAHVINMRNGGVGSLDESISTAMLGGRQFISIDNMRGRVDSQIMESALRGHGRVDVRAVRKAPVQISTHSFQWQLSSNGADMTRDLANRSIIIRVRKREPEYRFKEWPEGALVEHIRANQPFYLGCVFAVVKQWLARNKPKTTNPAMTFANGCEHSIGFARRLCALLRF
jgi:hypothetical protein